VGMRCRETLIAMVKKLGSAEIIPAGEPQPQAANVEKWCELVANDVANGPSADKVRKYLKDMSKDAWQLVNWATHSSSVTRADAEFAIQATQHVLTIFGTAVFR
jgi:hypothetical protein